MRYIFFFSILFAMGAGCQKQDPPPLIRPVRAMQLEAAELVRLNSFPGRTRAVDRANLSFRVEGQLIERPVYVGDHVLKGELLARLDPKDYEVSLQNSFGKLERVQADLRFAENDYKRAQSIWQEDPGAISKSMLEQKKEEANRLKGEVRALEAEVEHAEDRLRYTYLRAPYDGVVVATYVQNFEYVQAKQPIIRLLDTAQVEMVIDVPESMIADIPFVEKVVVEFDAIAGKEFPATVKEIGTEASTTTRTFPVTLLIEQPDETMIYAGMAGYAYLFSSASGEFSEVGFLLPPTALVTDDALDKTFVWVVNTETMTVDKQEVEKGRLTSQGIIITSGLEEGQWVVTAGVHYLRDGQEVRIAPVKLTASGEQVPAVEGEG
ncbi:MAG: Multidrug resistance protein MdtA [Chlamydiales bacterium]|nr:Multidrug resistance protein MdtA [Chlamydiales bacterium]